MSKFYLFKHLNPHQARTHRLDLLAALFFGVDFGYFAALPGLIQSVLGGSSIAVTILRVMQPGALLLAFFWANMIRTSPKMPWLIWSRTIGALLLLAISFHMTATTLLIGVGLFFFIVLGTFPALNAMYKENYPAHLRFRLVANIRIVTALAGAATGLLITYYVPDNELARGRLAMVTALTGLSSLVGVAVFRNIRLESDAALRRDRAAESLPDTLPLESPLGAIAFPTRDGRLPANGATNGATNGAANGDKPFSPRVLLRGLEKLGSDGIFRRYMIAYFIFGFSAQLFTPALDLYLYRIIHVTNAQIGAIYTTIPHLTAGLCMAFMGILLDRIDVFMGRSIFTFLWVVCVALMGLSVFGGPYALPIIYASRVVNGIAFAGSTLLWAIGSTYFARDSHEATEYQGVHNSLTGLRGIVGPPLAVLLIERAGLSYGLMFVIAALGMVISGTMTLRLAFEVRGDPRFQRNGEAAAS